MPSLSFQKSVAVVGLLLPKPFPAVVSFVTIHPPVSPIYSLRLQRWSNANTLRYETIKSAIHHNEDSSVDSVIEALEHLYPTASLDERIALSRKDGYWPFIQKGEDPPQELVYGEFDLNFFAQILERAAYSFRPGMDVNATQSDPGTNTKKTALPSSWRNKTFCDLGSGTGRLVLAAAALHPWRVCRGIELLEGIHQQAVATLQSCCPDNDLITEHSAKAFSASSVATLLPATSEEMKSSTSKQITLSPIELKCGSFDDPYEFFGDADLIFVFSSCMDTQVLNNLAQSIGRQCRSGCLVITTEYQLPLGGTLEPPVDDPEYPSGEYALELVESITGSNMATGGESTAHIHRVTKALGNGVPRERPTLSLSDICYRAIKAADDPSINDSNDFLRRVSNQMAFVGLPESWRPNLPP